MDLPGFIFEGIKAIIYGILFLIIALIFLPDAVTVFILNKLRPGLVRAIKEPLKKLIDLLASLYIEKNTALSDRISKKFSDRTAYFIAQNNNIEKNIYVIDLCDDMISMLRFVLPGTVGGDGFEVYEQSLYYLYHYSNLVEHIDQDKNFATNFMGKIEELRSLHKQSISREYPEVTEGLKIFHNNQIKMITNYLEEEKRKLQLLLTNNKKILVNLLQECTNVL